jgi:murein DD-endopeptidase MepM/ murein hydrolase activator NlpD
VIIEEPQHWRILIGIDISTLPGDYLLYLKRGIEGSTGEHHSFTVTQKNYPLTNTSESSQSEAVHRQRKRLSDIDFSNTQQPSLPLRLPISGNWSDGFGHQYINNDSSHLVSQNAVSLVTTELANVLSPQDAIVSKVETGQDGVSTIYLDHGRGLYSILEGITDLTVETGNGVVAGAVLGRLPSTGSASSPNTLIWQTQMNQVFVNPLILTKIQP